MGCEVESSRTERTQSDCWTLIEAGTATWTVLSQLSHSVACRKLGETEIAPLEVTLIPKAEDEALLPVDHDRNSMINCI